MKITFSKFMFGLSCFGAAVVAIATVMWFGIVLHPHPGARNGFIFYIAPVVSASLLLLAVMPSGIFYFLWRQRRDLLSFWISGASFLAVLVETVALFFVRLPYGC